GSRGCHDPAGHSLAPRCRLECSGLVAGAVRRRLLRLDLVLHRLLAQQLLLQLLLPRPRLLLPGRLCPCERLLPRVMLLAFLLRHAAPDAVRLAYLQRVVRARYLHGAVHADLLRRHFSARSRRTALALGVEEERAVLASAQTAQLPVPQIGVRAGEP